MLATRKRLVARLTAQSRAGVGWWIWSRTQDRSTAVSSTLSSVRTCLSQSTWGSTATSARSDTSTSTQPVVGMGSQNTHASRRVSSLRTSVVPTPPISARRTHSISSGSPSSSATWKRVRCSATCRSMGCERWVPMDERRYPYCLLPAVRVENVSRNCWIDALTRATPAGASGWPGR